MIQTQPSDGQSKPTSRLPGIRHVIAVGSGKGGVGKSTVAVNLALALQEAGASVAVLDADIYGPSLPIMLGVRDAKPTLKDERIMIPVETHGLAMISMGLLIKPDDAVVWRGPMLSKVLQQFIDDVDWGERDYLVIDLPPGTGDVQLSISQMLDVAGAVVVTTPQDVAMADVRRAMKMFEKTRIPVIGLVENMAWFTCPDTKKRYPIFGESRTQQAADEWGIPLLASMPIDLQLAPAADRGEPILVADPEGDQAERYRSLAKAVQQTLASTSDDPANSEKFSEFFSG
jgi:ATP-binding protein involved in chromosome partitioning